jgi:hypothetical protein
VQPVVNDSYKSTSLLFLFALGLRGWMGVVGVPIDSAVRRSVYVSLCLTFITHPWPSSSARP